MDIHNKRILVVDDDSFVRSIIKKILLKANSGFEIIEAADGVEALEYAKNRRPDVAIVDVVMPRMGGEELSRHLKGLYPDLPIIVLTGFDNQESKERLIKEVKVDQYLTKNQGFDRFYSVVSKLLD